MVRRPDAFFATNIASLILRPDLRFLTLTSLQSLNRPNLSLGSSSRISRRRQSFSVSRPRRRPPGNIHSRSRLLLTSKTRPRLAATSLDDFAILERCRSTTNCQHNFIPSFLQRKATSLHEAASERRCFDNVASIATETLDRDPGGRCWRFAEVLHREQRKNIAFAGWRVARRNHMILASAHDQFRAGGGIYSRGRLAALHRPILRMAIDRGAVAPVESLAVELRWAAPKLF